MAKIKLLVTGGKATAGPPLGPALAPMGINVGQVVADINSKTKAYEGLQVPVTVSVDAATKKFEVIMGSPPASALIKKELGLEIGAKGEAGKGQEVVGNITFDKLVKIAKQKKAEMTAVELREAVKQIVGTCTSMGVTIDNKKPKEIVSALNSGELKV